jgi:hypothetical protein
MTMVPSHLGSHSLVGMLLIVVAREPRSHIRIMVRLHYAPLSHAMRNECDR